MENFYETNKLMELKTPLVKILRKKTKQGIMLKVDVENSVKIKEKSNIEKKVENFQYQYFSEEINKLRFDMVKNFETYFPNNNIENVLKEINRLRVNIYSTKLSNIKNKKSHTLLNQFQLLYKQGMSK